MIAAPVGAGQLHQLERLRQLARRRQVRPAAEVAPLVAVRIERDRLARRDDVVDDLRLVVLADRLEVRDRVVLRPDLAIDRQIAVDDLLHLRFDLREVVRRERLLAREVVVEPVLDHRPDRHLRAGEQLLHRLRHHVRRIVAQQLQPVLRVDVQQLELAHRPRSGRFMSNSSPLTLAITDRLASDLEMASAIDSGVDPSGYSRTEPSGKDTLIIVSSFVVSADGVRQFAGS